MFYIFAFRVFLGSPNILGKGGREGEVGLQIGMYLPPPSRSIFAPACNCYPIAAQIAESVPTPCKNKDHTPIQMVNR